MAGSDGDPLAGIEAVDWGAVEHAYGPAVDVPGLLRTLRDGDEAERAAAHHQLWGNLYHQGTRYEASAVALPFVVALALDRSVPDREWVVDYVTDLVIGFQEPFLRDGFPQPGPARDERWQEGDPNGHAVYHAALGCLGSLQRLLGDPDPAVRAAASRCLAFLPDGAESTVPLLRERVVDGGEAPVVRADALHALGLLRQGEASREGDCALARTLVGDADDQLALAAAAAAVRLSGPESPDPPAVEHLHRVLVGDAGAGAADFWWADGDPASLAAFALERAGAIDLEVLCQALERAEPYYSLVPASILLRRVFPDASPPRQASELSPEQRRVVQALAATGAWSFDGAAFGNFTGLVGGYGLPRERESVRRWLAGAGLDEVPPGESSGPARPPWWRRLLRR